MRSSVADDLRQRDRHREAALTPEQRIALALALGRRDLRVFAEAHGLSLAEARRELRALAQRGRTSPSAASAGRP